MLLIILMLLKQIPVPPPFLFVLGPDDLAGPTVAIVGLRKASEYGVQIAGELAHGLVQRGICVVSGLAYGIDGAAYTAALKTSGRTVAVLGCGADVVYPAGHSGLYHAIRERGTVVSELPFRTHGEGGRRGGGTRTLEGAITDAGTGFQRPAMRAFTHYFRASHGILMISPATALCRRIAEAGVRWVGGSSSVTALLAAVALKDYPRKVSP